MIIPTRGSVKRRENAVARHGHLRPRVLIVVVEPSSLSRSVDQLARPLLDAPLLVHVCGTRDDALSWT
jgi:hypothetical protein